MNKIKFIAGAFGVFAVLLGGVALAQVTTASPVAVSQRYAGVRGAVTGVSADSLIFTGLSNNCQPSVLKMMVNAVAATTTSALPCSSSTYTIAQDQILVIAGDDKIVSQNSLIRIGTKGNLYLKDGQPYMLRVTGDISKPEQPPQKMCTMEAKQCPDGSFVGRQGPDCEFAKCGGNATSTVITEAPTSTPAAICVKTTDDNGETKINCRKLPPVLRRGMQGEDVKHIQELLKEKGLLQDNSVTGFFGSVTQGAIQQLQQQLGVPSTGLMGPMTMQKLQELQTQSGGNQDN